MAASVTQPEHLVHGTRELVLVLAGMPHGWQLPGAQCPMVWQLLGSQPSSRWEPCSENPRLP